MRPVSARSAFPGGTAGLEDVVVGRPQAVREEALAKTEPDPLDGVELRRIRRREQRRQAGRDHQILGDVPAGAIHQDDRMGAGVDGLAEFVEHRLHGGGADHGQGQGDPGIALGAPGRPPRSPLGASRGADGAEQIDRLVAQVARAAWAHAPSNQRRQTRPVWPTRARRETRSRGARPRGGMGDLGDQAGEFFLKRAWALRSASADSDSRGAGAGQSARRSQRRWPGGRRLTPPAGRVGQRSEAPRRGDQPGAA